VILTSRIEDPFKLNAIEWRVDVGVSGFRVHVRPWAMLKLHRPSKRHQYRVREVWCRMGSEARPYVREGAKVIEKQPPVPDLHKRAILDQMQFTFTFEDEHVEPR
jgi:hypothetical protein